MWASLIMFGVMYALLFVLFIYLLDNKIRHGPDDGARGQRRTSYLLQGDRAAT